MADAFIGEIRMFGGNFAPVDWAACAGQIVPIALYSTLYTLIGTVYGGDGTTTFGLPDLRGRVPVHQGNGMVAGQLAGSEEVTLTAANMGAHSHALIADDNAANATASAPAGAYYARTATTKAYSVPNAPGNDPPQFVPMNAAMVGLAGSNLPHENMQPFLTLQFIICLNGIFPARN